MDKWQKAASPVSVFYSYASEDEKLLHRLEKHLSSLRRQGLISDWYNYKIIAGSEREKSINSHLESASLILLLISSDFMASDYCYGVEMQRALDRHRAGLARVIPILLRPVDWQDAPFASLQVLPRNGKAIVRWDNRDEAFLAIVQEIRTAIDVMHDKEEEPSGQITARQPVQDQNRQRFLQRVRTTWIAGVLEQSLFNVPSITPDLHEIPDAVENPWRLLVQETQQALRELPPTTHIMEVYDEANGELLILGEPGAGKTTLLLELARALLTRAEYAADHPLPAIFNLSSWAEKRQPITTWLVEELHDRYKVPRKLGRAWVTADQILPLLDGLDEVVSSQRNECLAAVSHYHQEHSLVPLVVCSRYAEYMAQPQHIALQRAVVVQPLTIQQIDEYLSSTGEQMAALSIALHKDGELQKLASTPLMLNILMLTYQGKTLDELTSIKSPDLLRKQLFTQYISRMLQRRGVEMRYTSHYTITCLINLARQMKRHGQTEFYIEHIKRGWLADRGSKFFYYISVTLICVLAGMLIGGIVIRLIGGFTAGILQILLGLLGFGFISGFISAMNPEMHSTEDFIWSWNVLRREWPIILLIVFVGGLAGVLDINLNNALIAILTKRFVNISDANQDKVLVGMLVGVMFGGFIGLLFSVLKGGLEVVTDVRHIIKPNQEIHRSFRHSLLILGISALFVLLFIPLSRPGIILAGTFGLAGALGFGGLACIQHIVLRFLLWRSGQLPWNLPRFLDYAAERILLRKVGGGYIFMHRLLLEYFAGLDEDKSTH